VKVWGTSLDMDGYLCMISLDEWEAIKRVRSQLPAAQRWFQTHDRLLMPSDDAVTGKIDAEFIAFLNKVADTLRDINKAKQTDLPDGVKRIIQDTVDNA
jgi:hypothetical protein